MLAARSVLMGLPGHLRQPSKRPVGVGVGLTLRPVLGVPDGELGRSRDRQRRRQGRLLDRRRVGSGLRGRLLLGGSLLNTARTLLVIVIHGPTFRGAV